METGYLASDCHLRIGDLKTRIMHLCLYRSNDWVRRVLESAAWHASPCPLSKACRNAYPCELRKATREDGLSQTLDHLHQRSVCDPALEILDEVHQSNPVNPLKVYWDLEKMHSFEIPGGAL
jgi:hypothetical protein